jgi:homoserine O-acetyltransferase
MQRRMTIALGLLLGCALTAAASASDLLVEKQRFTIADFATQGGAVIPEMTLGWEAYGELNEARDNVVLIAHALPGTSHAAGRYTAEDPAPGYWDSIIGPGKAIDTDRFYVISVDTPVNLNAHDPNVITIGPASIDPATGEPWGMTFPILTIRDFVETQKALLDQLGIETLHAVMGASMGASQAYEWAASYPEKVERLIPVVGAGWVGADMIAWLDIYATPIRLDPDWQNGAYYDGKPPLRGLAEALKIATFHAQHPKWANATFGRNWANEGADPAASFDNFFQIQAALAGVGAARAATADANHFLYLVKANQLFVAGHGAGLYDGLVAIEAPALIIHSNDDQLFPGNAVRDTATLIRADGVPVQVVELAGTRGHLDGLINIAQAGGQIRAFLAD